MQEDFLHYIWKHHAFSTPNLSTTTGEAVVISDVGQHNFNAGPDFFNAQLSIDNQRWAGNVEIHIKSSDWYLHNHQNDPNYDNVILHVVWEHDAEIFRKDNSEIPTLELKHLIDNRLASNYKILMHSKSWINCEKDFHAIDDFHLKNWLDRLYIERLERKFETISEMLKEAENDWEAVLFKMLLKNFGLKVNGEAFLSISKTIDYTTVRKLQSKAFDLEALLFGQAGLLDKDIQETYFQRLREQFQFLKLKFKLNNEGVVPVQFFRLRPSNFPSIRLSQFANLYTREQQLFSKLMATQSKLDIYRYFNIGVSEFWKTHYTFKRVSKASNKMLSKAFIDLLVINTIIPLKFSYAFSRGKNNVSELLELVSEVSMENNSITAKFLDLRPMKKSALNSQALLQLKQDYCDKNKCLHCAIGNRLIVKN